MEGVPDVVKAELFGLLFQGGDQALVETDGGAAFPADDVVMVVAGFLRKIEGLSRQNDPLNQAGFAEGLQNAINGGAVADLRPDLGLDLFRGKRGTGFLQDFQNCPAPWSRFQARLPKGIRSFDMGMTHGEVKWKGNDCGSRKKDKRNGDL